MSLLQDVLRLQLEALEDAQRRASMAPAVTMTEHSLLSPPDSDDDETISVTSGAATPMLSKSKAATPRSSSPTRGTAYKAIKPSPLGPMVSQPSSPRSKAGGDLLILSGSADRTASIKRGITTDPLRVLPDRIRPFIFCELGAKDLANCSLVCQRWKKSQTINHAWYQLFRRDSYEENQMPVGKWTKRESKQDWRAKFLQHRRITAKESSPLISYSKPRTPARSGANTPKYTDGYLTPREIKEEEWSRQNEQEFNPGKVAMRDWYKEMGGKRIKKAKTGMSGGMGMRDRTAYEVEYN